MAGFEGISISVKKITLIEAFTGFVGINAQYDFGYLVQVVDEQNRPNIFCNISSSMTQNSITDENGVAYLDLASTDTIVVQNGTLRQSFAFSLGSKQPGIIKVTLTTPPSLL